MPPRATSNSRPLVYVSGSFDDIRSCHLRFLQEAAQHGSVTVGLWSDEYIHSISGAPPRFPFEERNYFLSALRYVTAVYPVNLAAAAPLPSLPSIFRPQLWLEMPGHASDLNRQYCSQHGIRYEITPPGRLSAFPEPPPLPCPPGQKKVIVTGCFDWLHSGHIRFFEEVSTHGALYVVVGHDANIRLLKGEGHPLLSQEERRYVVGSVRFVSQALISTGEGWLDAEPEIQRLKPDIYAVNADGDKGGKRDYCHQHGIEYLVLKRIPAPGLPPRSSTNLRGF